MSQQDLDKWNQRYAQDSYRKSNPVTLVSDWLHEAPAGKALDIACGAGRNSILLAQQGFAVDAIDISPEGLRLARQKAEQEGLEINWIVHDLDDPYPFDQDYALIIVMWYVNLELIEQLCDCLAPGGVLICEEHLNSDEDVIGPGNSDFRVAPGSLRHATRSLDILLYEETVDDIEDGKRISSARVVARRS